MYECGTARAGGRPRRAQAGTVSAEYIGAVVLVGAIIVAVWATDISDRVSLASSSLVCNMFDDSSWDCPDPLPADDAPAETDEDETSPQDPEAPDDPAAPDDPDDGTAPAGPSDDPAAPDDAPAAPGASGGTPTDTPGGAPAGGSGGAATGSGSGGTGPTTSPGAPPALSELYAPGSGRAPTTVTADGRSGLDLTGDGTPDLLDTTGDGRIDTVSDGAYAGLVGVGADPDAVTGAIRDGQHLQHLGGAGLPTELYTLPPDERAEALRDAAAPLLTLGTDLRELLVDPLTDRAADVLRELAKPARERVWTRNPDAVDADQRADTQRLLDHLADEGADVRARADGSDPRDVWLALDSLGWDRDELEDAARARPELFGRVNGVPAHARDVANRERIPDLLERSREAIDELEQDLADLANRSGLRAAAERRVAERNLRERRRQLEAIGAFRDDDELLILDLRTGIRGRAVIGYGDVDAADHLTTIVPGAETTLGNLRRTYGPWLDNLQEEASAQAGDASTATVLALDYDTPVSLAIDAPRRGNAEQSGAPRLPTLLRGLDATERQTRTVIGHSYGSLVLGLALVNERDHGQLAADNLVAAGTAGMGVDEGSELGVRRAQQLYLAQFDGDAVGLSAGDRMWHGTDPATWDETIDLEVEWPGYDDEPSGAGEVIDRATEIHMGYADRNSDSLRKLAEVAVSGAEDGP